MRLLVPGSDPGRQATLRQAAALIEASEDPIIGLNRDGMVTSWNPAAERLYGYGRDEAIGQPITMLIPPRLRRAPGQLLPAVREGRSIQQHETVRMTKDGREVHVSISISPIRDEAGEVVGAAAFTRDITERKRAEQELRDSQLRLNEAEQVASLGSWEWDIATDRVVWSLGMYRILGLEPMRVSPTYDGYFEAVHPDDREPLRQLLERALVEPEPFEDHHRILRGDGAERIVQARGEAVRDASGLVVRLIGTLQDVTERRRAEEELERLTHRLEAILNSVGDAIVGMDPEGRATFINAGAARLTGHAPEELVGRSHHAAVHHTRADGAPYRVEECPIETAISDGVVRSGEELFSRKDGTPIPVEYTVAPLHEDGRVTGAVMVYRDVSERQRVQRLKDEFVSVVSHELRTPLTSLRGSLGLLGSGVLGRLPERGQRMVDVATQNADRLVRLINDILDIERMESGRLAMRRESCEAPALVERALAEIGPMADDHGVRLEASPEPVTLWADPDRILQTLVNLLSNAIKFSPRGGTVRLSTAAGEGEVRFQVRDEGRGIPPDKLDAVFERFEQVDASDTRSKGGTGLGLAICRSIVEEHGGRIWAESAPGQGAIFSFTVPAPAGGVSAPQDEAGAVPSG